MAATVREFFEGLESRLDPARTAGTTVSYLFDVEGAGQWKVDVNGGKVSVSEGEGEAGTTISTTEETFLKITRGEENPQAAFMSGKLKVTGDMGAAMKLEQIF